MMDGDLYTKILLFLLVVGAGGTMMVGIKTDAGHSTWATKCLLFSGVVFFLAAFVGFLVIISEEYLGGNVEIVWAFVVVVSAIVYVVGMIGFCARFGATHRRIVQLEEIESALSAAVAHTVAEHSERKESL